MNRLFLSLTLTILAVAPLSVRGDDTPNAAKMRKIVKETKIDVDWAEERLEIIMEELKEKVPGFKFRLDGKGGVSRNSKLSFKGKGVTVEEVLGGLCKAGGDLGWYIIAVKNNAYDGLVLITKGGERGYEKGKEPK